MFNEKESFTRSVSSLPDKPVFNSYAEAKGAFDAATEELRVSFNELVKALKKTEKNDSGAKNIGATSISGLDGTDIQSILESLTTKYAKKTQEDWQDLPLANSWIYYGTGSKPQFYKNELGEVFVKGIIKGGSGNGLAVAVLPSGYRPKETRSFVVWDGVNSAKRIDVEPNGFVRVPVGWTVNNAYLTIDLPPFKAE